MNLSRGILVSVGPLKGHIFGGPFRKYEPGTRRLIGIKMAVEIDHPHDFAVDTEDFSVPEVSDMQDGLIAALASLAEGSDVYVGCMGGIGRTGLFMGCMVKFMQDYAAKTGGPIPCIDPVANVRSQYNPHAIETREQQDYVRTFDTAPVISYFETLTAPVVVVETKVEYLTPFEAIARWWIGR